MVSHKLGKFRLFYVSKIKHKLLEDDRNKHTLLRSKSRANLLVVLLKLVLHQSA